MGNRAWLLIKDDDEDAVPAKDVSIVEDKPRSMATSLHACTRIQAIWMALQPVAGLSPSRDAV